MYVLPVLVGLGAVIAAGIGIGVVVKTLVDGLVDVGRIAVGGYAGWSQLGLGATPSGATKPHPGSAMFRF